MTTWFTSDLHFGHKRICELANRPFADLDAMQDAFVTEWNDTVAKGDLIYHLGDFSFLNAHVTSEILRSLKGQKHMIAGNHDEALRKAWKADYLRGANVAWVRDYHELRFDGQKVVLFHFPVAVWNGAHNGSWHLHGHSHGNFDPQGQPMMDVGYDATGKVLISWDEVSAVLSTRTYQAADHHGLD